MFQKVIKRKLTVGHADLTAAVNGTAQTINIGQKPPTGSRLLTRELTGITQFTGGSASSCTLDIGGTDADAIVAAENVLGGGTVNRQGTSGVNPGGDYGGQQLTATFTPDASHTLAGLTAGAVTITLTFIRVK